MDPENAVGIHVVRTYARSLYWYVPSSWLHSRGQMLEFQLTMKLSKMKVVLWDLDSQLLILEKIEAVKHSFSPSHKSNDL